MNKRKICSYIVMISLSMLVIFCGTVTAYMITRTEFRENRFTPAQVSCMVDEETDADQAAGGMTKKTSITIQNTGNIDAYLRIRFVSYWVQNKDGNTEIVGKASVMPTIDYNTTDWIRGAQDTYYYISPVAPDTSTGELLNSPIELDEKDGYKQVVEVFAEAIQSLPTGAVTNSWNVTLDASGHILTVP